MLSRLVTLLFVYVLSCTTHSSDADPSHKQTRVEYDKALLKMVTSILGENGIDKQDKVNMLQRATYVMKTLQQKKVTRQLTKNKLRQYLEEFQQRTMNQKKQSKSSDRKENNKKKKRKKKKSEKIKKTKSESDESDEEEDYNLYEDFGDYNDYSGGINDWVQPFLHGYTPEQKVALVEFYQPIYKPFDFTYTWNFEGTQAISRRKRQVSEGFYFIEKDFGGDRMIGNLTKKPENVQVKQMQTENKINSLHAAVPFRGNDYEGSSEEFDKQSAQNKRKSKKRNKKRPDKTKTKTYKKKKKQKRKLTKKKKKLSGKKKKKVVPDWIDYNEEIKLLHFIKTNQCGVFQPNCTSPGFIDRTRIGRRSAIPV